MKALEAKLVLQPQAPVQVTPSLFGPVGTIPMAAPDPTYGVAPVPGTAVVPSLYDQVTVLESKVKEKVKELDAQMGHVTITMRGYTFKCTEDCETFILQYMPGNTYAHFYSMVSLAAVCLGQESFECGRGLGQALQYEMSRIYLQRRGSYLGFYGYPSTHVSD
jgi:hypothetical protein